MRITAAGLKESHPHDIQMTVEAPNYSDLSSRSPGPWHGGVGGGGGGVVGAH